MIVLVGFPSICLTFSQFPTYHAGMDPISAQDLGKDNDDEDSVSVSQNESPTGFHWRERRHLLP